MATPIYTWKYIQDRKYPSKVELFYDHILEHRETGSKVALRHSFEEFLLRDQVLVNLMVDFELLEYITTISVLEEYSPEAQIVYRFYQGFDHDKIRGGSYEHETNHNSPIRYFKTMNKHGLEQYLEKEDGIFIQSRQRFDQFFTKGPVMSDLPFDLRKRWRQSVWSALGSPKPYRLEDGFPLFDYQKIVPKSYKHNTHGKHKGEFLEIHSGHILIGGWDGREGGAQKYAIEQVWYDERLIPKSLEAYLHEIHDNLAGAIVEGNRSRGHRQLQRDASLKDYGPQNPGEAPPA